MKSWLVFLGGAICGAAVASVMTWVLFFKRPAPIAEAATARSGATTTLVETGRTNETANYDDGKPPLESRVALLKAWTEEGGAEPEGDELYGTLGDWAERDPMAALAWVHGAKRLPQRLHILAVPLAALARKNRAEAANWLRQNLSGRDRTAVLESAFQHLAGNSPRAALELVTSFPSSEQPDDLGDALGELIAESPGEALGYFNQLTGQQRENSARWMLASWARKDAASAMVWVDGNRDVAAVQPVRWAFLDECMRTRPDLCVEFLRKFPNTGDTYGDSGVISGMLQHSPEHGVAALALVPAETAETALSQWARDCFEKSPERAIELAKAWVPEKMQSALIRGGFEAWLDSDHRAAMEWLGTVKQPELQVALQAGVIAWQAQRDPESALAVLHGPMAASPELKDVVAQALMGWAQRDVTSAANWVVANPGLVTADQVSELTTQLLEKDEGAGADWLGKLPAGDVRDSAIATAAVHWADLAEPELATQAASTIRDPQKRTRALFSVYNSLRSTDQTRAERWLGEQGLAEETKQSWRAITGGR
jgi:hypothetical protein